MSTDQETPSDSAPSLEPSLSDTVSRLKIKQSSSKLVHIWQEVIPNLQGSTKSASASSTSPVQARHGSAQSHRAPLQGHSSTIYSTPARNPMLTVPPTAGRNLVPSNEAETGGTTATSAAPPEATLGPETTQPQDLFREPLEIPGCKKKIYVYRHADALISDAHKERYHKIIDLFREKLLAVKALSKSGPANTLYKLKMCGPGPEKVKPSILVCHSWIDKDVSRQIWKNVTEKSLRKQYECTAPVFGIYMFFSPKFWMLGSSMKSLSIYIDNGLIIGAPLVSNNTSYQVSTLACGISLSGDNTIFALTSAHAFENNAGKENDKSALSYDDSITGSGSQESDETSGHSFSSTDDEYDWDELESAIAREKLETGLSYPNERGFLKDNSKEGPTGYSEIKPGRVWGRRNNPEWENLDWALVEIPSFDQRSLLSWSSGKGSFIEPSCLSKAAGAVIVATASGLLEGTLSSIPSYLASSRNFTTWTKIWTLSLTDQDQRRLRKGDSGSAVLNLEQNRVYGYVTALNPFGELHVMPLEAILNQIRVVAAPPNPGSKLVIFDKVGATNSSNNNSTIRAERWPSGEKLIQLWPEEPAEVPNNESSEVTASPLNDGSNQMLKPLPIIKFRTQNLDILPDTIPFSEGLLGNFPLLGRFSHGFLEHRAECERTLIQARANSEDPALARALLDIGAISMLQGELVSAVNYLLEAAERARNRFPTLRVLALSYTVHCRTMQYIWSPNGCNIILEELSRIFDYLKRVPLMLEDITETKRHTGYDAHYNWVGAIITFQQQMVSARPVTPTSENIALTKNVGLPQIEAMIALLQAMGIGGDVLVGMLIERAWVYRIIGDRSKFESNLHIARKEIQDHSALAAHVEMRLGDDHCTSFGTPETWDTVLERGTESNAQARDEETLHFMGGSKGNISLAKSHYEKAEEIFRTLDIRRGIAGIQLRLGYIATLSTSLFHISGDSYKKALEHIVFAEDLYRSCGDCIGTQIARAHLCLCRIGIGQEPEDTALAKSIGVWGREHGSFSFAFGIGLFFAKYARRWLVAFGDYERAVAAHRLAEALFDGLDTILPRLFSITDQMAVYESLGERDRFKVIAEHALDICAEVLESQEGPIADKVFNHKVQILTQMFLQAQKHADPDEIFSVATRLRATRILTGDGKGSTAFSFQDFMKNYFGRPQPMHEIVSDDIEQLRGSSQASDIEMLLKNMESLDFNPLEFQTRGATMMIDHMSSLADFLVPFYRGRRASREGNEEMADTLWEVARASLEENSNEQKDVLLTLLYTEMKMYDKALAHTKAYLAKCLAEHHALPTGKTHEDKGLMDRGLWQSKNQVLAMFARTRHFKEAGSFLEEIQHEWGKDWWKVYEERVWENLSLAGQINAGLQNYETACDYYEQAMQAFEERRDQLSTDDYKIALAGDSNVQEIYFGATLSAIKWHFSLGQTRTVEVLDPQLQRAFANLERGKARSLLDLIGGSALSAKISLPQSHNHWSEYKQQTALLTTRRALLANAYSSGNQSDSSYIRQLKEDVAMREQQLRDIAKRLSESGQPRSAPVTATRVIDLPEICSLLTDDTAILQYSYQRNDLIAWMITVRGMIEVYHIEVPEAELERNVHEYHRACERLTSDIGRYASWLGKTLLPFKSLKEHTRLIIVAYRTLHLVPFHSLTWEQKSLISTHSVSYLPSASLLRYLGQWQKLEPSFSVLAVGDPSNMVYRDPFNGVENYLTSLPSSALEASQVARIVPGSAALIGNAATNEAVYSQMNHHSVLHFGAHGSLFSKIPMLSAIHLAGGSQITVDQLMGRDLKAELVVLSACNTGRGRITDGDDVVGFARALLAAGVKHVVVSLWPVDDDATCYLMEQFYENLMKSMPVAKALRAAQETLKDSKKEEVEGYLVKLRGVRLVPQVERVIVEDYSHPKFWAPFVLIGV